MARKGARGAASVEHTLRPLRSNCPLCGRRMWADYDYRRTVVSLSGSVGLILKIRRCRNRECQGFLKPYRPEAEGRFALPQHEFGLDVIALVGALRYAEHRSVPEIHGQLLARGLSICERTVTNLLDRYDELLAVSLTGDRRVQRLLKDQGRVILALDGMQPDWGHEVHRAGSGSGDRLGSGRDGGLLQRGEERDHGRRPPTAGSLGPEAPHPFDESRRQFGQGGFKKGLPRPLEKLKQRLDDALSKTTLAWPPLRVAFGWVHQVAHILANHEASAGHGLRRRLNRLVRAMTRHRPLASEL